MKCCGFGSYVLAMVLAGVVCAGTAEKQEAIQRLARDGKTAEAIAMFESLPDANQASADVLRAVAGCYWREGRFDDARTLYRLIMEQQPNLKTVSGEADRSALLARDPVVVAEPSVPEAPVAPDKAVPAVAEPVRAVTEPVAVVTAAPTNTPVEKVKEVDVAPAGAAVTQTLQAEMDALRRMSEEARAQIEAQTLLLADRITALSQDTASARSAYDQLKTTSDSKINDLLDAITAEKIRNESTENELKKVVSTVEERLASSQASVEERQRLADELRVALDKEKQQLEEGRGREAALQTALNEAKAAQETSLAEVKRLELSLVELRGQHESVSGQLKARDAEVQQLLEQLKSSPLAVALQEIELLEKEHAHLTEAAASRQAELQSQIEALDAKLSGGAAEVESVKLERDAALGQRADLESRLAGQAKELAEAKELIAAAMAALARQYEAIREQVREGGVTMRLEGEAETQAGDGVVLEQPTELVPLIGQLEAATVKAGEDVRQLRDLLESQRLAFEAAAQEKNRELDGFRQQTATLTKQLSEQAVAAQAARAESEAVLKGEIESLVKAAKDRERVVLALEEELDAERASTVRVLELARETEAALSARIRDLEAAFALPDTESAGADASMAAAEEPLEPKYREIVDLLPRQHKKAVALFEALPSDAALPSALLKAMGDHYRDQKKYEQALALFEQMVKQKPQDLYAERKLVMTLFDMGRYDQALERLAGPAVVLPEKK